MNVIHVNNPDGTTSTYELRGPDTVTLVEWVNLVVPPLAAASTVVEDLERTYGLIQRYASIPRDVLRRIAFSELQRMVDAMSNVIDAAAKAQEDTAPLPDTVDHGGVVYTVPKDLGAALTTGQYIDIVARLEKCEYEAESIAVVLAVMLTEEGKGYDSTGLEDRILTMGKLPALTAIRLSAFFFAGSAPLNEAWSRYMSSRLRSKLQAVQQGLTSMTGSGDGTGSLPASQDPTGN